MWRSMPFLLVAAGSALLPSAAPASMVPAAVVLIFIIAGTAASLQFGWAGLPDFSIAAWFFAGGWGTAATMQVLPLPFWACVALSAAAITIVAVAITSPLLRLRSETFAMVTLAIAVIIPAIVSHQTFFTVRTVTVSAATLAETYDVLIAIVLLAGALAVLLERSPLGLALRAGEDRILCGSIGLNIRRSKLLVVAMSASTAATAGCMLPALQVNTNSAFAGFDTIAAILAIAMIAGRRSSAAVMAALIIAGIPQFVPALSDYRLLLAGAAIFTCAAWRVFSPNRGGNTPIDSLKLTQMMEAGAE